MSTEPQPPVESTMIGLGQRLSAYRRALGFRSAQELADAVPNAKITAAVIQNIESGRKADISVSQLLDLSHALGLSPLFLLSRVGHPESRVDLPGVGAAVGGLTNHELDEWICAGKAPSVNDNSSRETVYYVLRTFRDIYEDLAEWERLARDPERTAEPYTVEWTEDDGTVRKEIRDPAPMIQSMMDGLEKSIDGRLDLFSRISPEIDVTSVPRPWRERSGTRSTK